MTSQQAGAGWTTAAVLVARLIFVAVFTMATAFKFADMNATAMYIASFGFPVPTLLAWLAAFFELALIVCLATGAYYAEAALVAAAYVIFLGFAFHGPATWTGNQAEFGFFVDHFTFTAGLLYAAVHGPGPVLAVKAGLLRR